MAISGPGGGKHDDDFDDAAGGFNDINITPLTDIFLVLLIIFMVTSSVIVNSSSGAKAGLKVNLPQGGSADVAAQANDLSVAILSDGRLVLGGDVGSHVRGQFCPKLVCDLAHASTSFRSPFRGAAFFRLRVRFKPISSMR